MFDINGDGKPDGPAVDKTGGTTPNAIALDMDCDGIYDSLDTTGDGVPDLQTSRIKVTPPRIASPSIRSLADKGAPAVVAPPGMAGAPPVGGAGGSVAHAGGPGSAGRSPERWLRGRRCGQCQLGAGKYQGSGTPPRNMPKAMCIVMESAICSSPTAGVRGWQNQSISWAGTSFTVKSLNGTQGADYSPAGYPSVFCGLYSKKQSEPCGLPITITSAKSIKTGWRWKANGNNGQYNAAWDIWLGNGGTLSSYLMVWLRDPPGQQPAGSAALAGATVTGLPGTWNIWKGMVNGLPIVNYVQPEGKDLSELEFNVLDVYNDAIKRNYSLPGAQILAVAVGYEVWNGPVTNLATEDFYVDAK
ncbi:MAG: hypothetical protein WDO74_36190 [Pseudomonadota bacterium]